jgi:hypothetical protein
MSGILAANSANITNLRLSNREGGFHTYDVVVEVRDVQHMMRILSALRASDTVVQAERLVAHRPCDPRKLGSGGSNIQPEVLHNGRRPELSLRRDAPRR